jgi:hypothetical protein
MAIGSVSGGGRHDKGESGFGPDVSPAYPCPACGKSDWCSWFNDGARVFCRRPSISGRLGGKPGRGGSTFRVADLPGGAAVRGPKSGPRKRKKTRREVVAETDNDRYRAQVERWTDRARRAAAHLLTESPERRCEIAADLGLPAEALERIPGLGLHPPRSHAWEPDRALEHFEAITCPERDADFRVIGLRARSIVPPDERDEYPTAKVSLSGSWAGLTMPATWTHGSAPLVIPEGMTDVLSLSAAGVACLGRPSNRGAIDLIADALRKHISVDRPVLWSGENDQKTDGSWPGDTRDAAAELARLAGRPILYALPPDGAKDVRAWLTARIGPKDSADARAEAGAALLQKLLAAAETLVPPTAADPAPPESGPGPGGTSGPAPDREAKGPCTTVAFCTSNRRPAQEKRGGQVAAPLY